MSAAGNSAAMEFLSYRLMDLYDSGVPMKNLAKERGLTRERVRQLIEQARLTRENTDG